MGLQADLDTKKPLRKEVEYVSEKKLEKGSWEDAKGRGRKK